MAINHLSQTTSLNNRLILSPYKNEGQLKAVVQHGIAMIAQKVTLKPLELLVSAQLSDGTFVPQGSTIFVKEEHLHAQPWAKKMYECDGIKGQFIIVDLAYVEFIQPKTVA